MNYVFKIDDARLPELLEYYQSLEIAPTSPDIVKMFKSGDLTVSLYKTGKVLLQGADAQDEYLMWSELFGFAPAVEPVQQSAPQTPKSALGTPPPERPAVYFTSAIGSDEVGTGDFFGPVVVCAAYVPKAKIQLLESLKIRDSKKLTDEYIREVALELGKLVPHVILVTEPTKYNELVAQGYNMNKIKAYLHNHAIKKCLLKADGIVEKVIVDEFCSPDNYYEYLKDVDVYKKITFLTKGESAHLAVAAASVLARDAFLQRMDELNKTLKIRLPLGAGAAVDLIGKLVVMQHGIDFLPSVAKVNFKNMDRIRDLTKKT
ncbi:MAG TPA: ribonuclease HIII [Acholeplasmatales bacterium]|nr:MAG: ribonuclease HIII [Tenericutes bacterium GWF2_57_13]HAQ56050.1 ribonuclease HIII [Acholeplasmatales bacterium]